ncbi:SusD-like starch-binding protein associating with outer membrane [Leeuwenhoekiella aestuarii]|uniref:SusD-like starch-binding protein associating with outer membrane n=1 Tax=Leeuwenhoekiella aestuarii TaxID=2249426 RepID=A0A4Q0NN89_9FLAO|nr:SusD/RagB family nutrient-binding outer membrane lipoprotein [Leeuwenhoekiella aestuarii]RXG11315.1 SusD-like starch-binding protein associating with outer membrane [Leeuwenhoekiella aestuarii]RXG11853.1 SusD-like starch-binding protein associating with outer membrane [Leeuwenhoekiella aestuarii]
MKTSNIVQILVLACLLITGCTDNFEEINTNPNAPETVSANLLTATVTSEITRTLTQEGYSDGNSITQLMAKNNFPGFAQFDWGDQGMWNFFYGILPEIDDILQISRNEETQNSTYEGIALTLRALCFANLTDLYGNVPYSEALAGDIEGIFTPVYDSQEMIYNGVLQDLANADVALAANQSISGTTGDVIYDGDPAQWRKLANALRLRYLLRISKQRDVSQEMQAIASTGNYINTNADNATLTYSGTSNTDSWPQSTGRIGGFDEKSLCDTALEYFNTFNDPRLDIWFDRNSEGKWVGMPIGLNQDNARAFDDANSPSRLDVDLFYYSRTDAQAYIIKNSEVQFILAEAAERGIISGDAEAYYNAGVRASLSYWGVDDTTITTYLAQPAVSYNGSLELLLTQKTIALWNVDYQGWMNYRRTGLPALEPGPDTLNGAFYPVRFLYPSSEQTLNTANYQNAVNAMGGDNINVKGWWETGTRY